jgi:hypothetical protein
MLSITAEDLIQNDPQKYNGYHWKAVSLLLKSGLPEYVGVRRKLLEDARDQLNESIARFPDQVKDRVNLVETSLALAKYTDAEGEARELIERSSTKTLSPSDVLIGRYLLCLASLLGGADYSKSCDHFLAESRIAKYNLPSYSTKPLDAQIIGNKAGMTPERATMAELVLKEMASKCGE